MSVSVLSIAAKLEASIGMAKIKRRLAHLLSIGEGYNGRVLIDLGPSGRLLVDHGEVSVPYGEKPAQTSLAIDLHDLDQFLGGQLTVQMLMMTERLRIAGRMTDALHFARYLELEIFGRSALPA